ncbi:MAG: hypothetical protein WC485_00260 [Opitutaceae bacterium]
MTKRIVNPLAFKQWLWPDVTFYREQRQIIESVWNDDETVVPAGNMLGKDFVAAFIVLCFFLTRHPCRIVTTSAKDDHLRVLWGEIGHFIQKAKYPLDAKSGGPLVVNHHDLRKIRAGQQCPLSYVTGLVASRDSIAAMQGHHIANTGDGVPRTLFVCDESSSVSDSYYTMASTWFNRALIIGNTWPCRNFFHRGVKGGDKFSEDGTRCYRRVIRIRAEDSPNVRLAMNQVKAGVPVTNEIVVPGVKSYPDYLKNRSQWDEIQQCVCLDARFYEGAELLMFPPAWLDAAEAYAATLPTRTRGASMAVDSAQGGDNTAWAIVDERGLLHLESKKTPDTTEIVGRTLALMREYHLMPENILFDIGGGGKQHADRLRLMGYKVATVAFGESATPEIRHGVKPLASRKEDAEVRYVYKNRRAEMYGVLRLRLKTVDQNGRLVGSFALPAGLLNRRRLDSKASLREQLSPIPLTYDSEGRMRLLPKYKNNPDSNEKSLTELIGCSPDEADSVAMAEFHRTRKRHQATAGVC